MFLDFVPGPRDVQVGDRVVVTSRFGGRMYVTLSGVHTISKITKSCYHVMFDGYKTPERIAKANTDAAFGWRIVTVAEAQQQLDAYAAGERRPIPGHHKMYGFCYGEGAID